LYFNANNTLIYTGDAVVPSNFTYTKTLLNNNNTYKIICYVVYINGSDSWTDNITVYYPSKWGITPSTDDIDSILTDTIGPSFLFIGPIGASDAVGWVATIVLIIITFIFFIFDRAYAGLGLIGVGICLGFVSLKFTLPSVSVTLAGVFVLLGILLLWIERRSE
jgi:hypothetical protein